MVEEEVGTARPSASRPSSWRRAGEPARSPARSRARSPARSSAPRRSRLLRLSGLLREFRAKSPRLVPLPRLDHARLGLHLSRDYRLDGSRVHALRRVAIAGSIPIPSASRRTGSESAGLGIPRERSSRTAATRWSSLRAAKLPPPPSARGPSVRLEMDERLTRARVGMKHEEWGKTVVSGSSRGGARAGSRRARAGRGARVRSGRERAFRCRISRARSSRDAPGAMTPSCPSEVSTPGKRCRSIHRSMASSGAPPRGAWRGGRR